MYVQYCTFWYQMIPTRCQKKNNTCSLSGWRILSTCEAGIHIFCQKILVRPKKWKNMKNADWNTGICSEIVAALLLAPQLAALQWRKPAAPELSLGGCLPVRSPAAQPQQSSFEDHSPTLTEPMLRAQMSFLWPSPTHANTDALFVIGSLYFCFVLHLCD